MKLNLALRRMGFSGEEIERMTAGEAEAYIEAWKGHDEGDGEVFKFLA